MLKRRIEKQHKSAPLLVDKPRWNYGLCEYESKHYKIRRRNVTF